MRRNVNYLIAFLILTTIISFGIVLGLRKPDLITPLAVSQSRDSIATALQKTSILLLGLDARTGDKKPRCDAIHMISLDQAAKTITIVTIPRGTEVPVPEKKNEYTYLSNSCHTYGIDYAVSQIQKITGVKNNYLVRVGFSQTLGILRLLNIPTTPTLQYLRNRSLPLGDYQRSHNQAVFIKDTFVNHFDKLASLPKPILYLFYKMVYTDMDFDTAYNLYTAISQSQIHKDPQNIILVTKPPLRSNIREMHFTDDNDKNDWTGDSEFQAYQKDMEGYLDNLIKKSDFNLIKTPFEQRIWEQVESEKRYKYHFELLRIYVSKSPVKENLPSLVLDFISEMEALQKDEWKKKGEELLDRLSK